MTSLLITLCLVSAPVPPPKTDGIQVHHLVGEYHDVEAPGTWMVRRFVLSSNGSYWSHWNGEEYIGTWEYDRTGDRVVIMERPTNNPARSLQEWSLWNVRRRGGALIVNRYVRVR